MFDDGKNGVLVVLVVLVLCGISTFLINHFYPDAPLLMHGLSGFSIGVLVIWAARMFGALK